MTTKDVRRQTSMGDNAEQHTVYLEIGTHTWHTATGLECLRKYLQPQRVVSNRDRCPGAMQNNKARLLKMSNRFVAIKNNIHI